MRILLLLLCLLALPSWGATLSTTTCTITVKTGCTVLDVSTLNQLPSSVGVQLSGTWTGAVQFEGSVNGTTYVAITSRPVAGGSWASEATGNGVWVADVAGLLYFRARASALTSGTITVHITPTTARPVTDIVRAVGSTFGNVAVTGSVELGASTQAALAAPECTFSAAPPVLTLTTTAQTVPSNALADRTQLIVKNLSGVHNVWCCSGDACTPTSTAAYVILPNGDYQSFPARATDVIRCRAAAGTAEVNAQEASCG